MNLLHWIDPEWPQPSFSQPSRFIKYSIIQISSRRTPRFPPKCIPLPSGRIHVITIRKISFILKLQISATRGQSSAWRGHEPVGCQMMMTSQVTWLALAATLVAWTSGVADAASVHPNGNGRVVRTKDGALRGLILPTTVPPNGKFTIPWKFNLIRLKLILIWSTCTSFDSSLNALSNTFWVEFDSTTF